MKTILHKNEERGVSEHGWLSSRFSFSFADWYEPTRMGFGALRVINDDVISPNSGFGMHPHRDMEIITIVTGGAVTHKDSAGNIGHVPAGSVQVMSAGRGVTHSEYNDSEDTPLTLFQIWILPQKLGVDVAYGEKAFDFENAPLGETILVAPQGEALKNELTINQEAWITYGHVDALHPLTYNVKRNGNGVYALVISGDVNIGGQELSSRDALGISETDSITISGNGRLLLIDVPMH